MIVYPLYKNAQLYCASRSRPRPKKPAVGAADFFLWSARAGAGRPRVCARRANAQDALMIGKTSRVVAMKYARPTTPRTANTAKDTFFQWSCRPLDSWGFFQISNSTPVQLTFRLHSINFNSSPRTGENW